MSDAADRRRDTDPPRARPELRRDELLGGALPEDWRSPDELRSLFALSPTATWIIDVEQHEVYANQATATLFHLEPSPDVTLPDGMAVLHEDERERTLEEITQLLSGELEAVSRVKHYVRPDGSEFWGHLDSRAMLDGEGKPWAILSTCRDVTQQREAEQALVEREAWFEALVRHNVDPIIVVDERAILTYLSPSAEELGGMTNAEWVGQNALDLVHPDDVEIVAESFANTAATPGTAVPLRFRMVRTDGTTRLVEAVATNLLDDPAVHGVVVNLRDLTEREQVATALEMSENRFRKMLENISDTVTLVDATGQVLRTTGNVKSILGYPTDFWAVRNAFDIAHPDDLEKIGELQNEVLANPGGEVQGEFRVRHFDGHYEVIEANAVNLLDDPDIAAIVLTTRNITDRKAAEQALADARDQALRALEVRNEFVASVSHELRTPIHGILGLAELLATSNDVTDEVVQLAVSIRRATDSLRLVLDDILDFTKIEAGRLELNEQAISLRELLDDLDVLFGSQAAAKGIALRISAADELPATFFADGLRLRQVLNNLVSNAIKFTSDGEVAIMLRRDDASSGRPRLHIQVTDTGIGMSPEIVQRVFEPFSQAHATTAREYGGTGLGLTIARRLIELMDGSLAVDSELGRGTTFDVVLPLRTRGVVSDGTPEEQAAAGVLAEPHRVLVVEDNPVNQLLVGRQLDRLGYDPIVVGSGEAAVEQFTTQPVDAVLMDWQMPGMDGLEAAAQLRKVERRDGRARVPIIAMTASAMPGDRERCLAAGMDDFIAKPVNLATLGRTMASWLYTAAEAPVEDERRAAEPDAVAAVNGAVLDRLLEELDDPALVATVLATYRRELPGRVEAIEDAARAADVAALQGVAHTLKSTSAALGAERMSELCRELEDAARLDDAVPATIEPLLAKVGAERARVEAALEREAERFLPRATAAG